MLTLLNKISKLYTIKLLTRGRGVKKVQKYADVICESPQALSVAVFAILLSHLPTYDMVSKSWYK